MERTRLRFLILTVAVLLTTRGATQLEVRADDEKLDVLFLGDNGHHRPTERAKQLIPAMAKCGIDVTYTDQATDLNSKTLAGFDALIIYANIGRIEPAQEKALLDFVAGGKGFVPIHCASYCFLNSPKYIELVGAQFKSHGTGTFQTDVAKPDHPVMKGFGGFESWDETYVHDKHNEKNRVVLSYRADGDGREPWTWIRNHGDGRVFYTAWGHDQRTWSNPGFHNLIERGIRWAAGGDPSLAGNFDNPDYFPVPEMTAKRKDVKPFEYVDAKGKIPFYPPGKNWGTLGEPITKMQLPLPAGESLKHMVVPEGFDVKLFAAEPDIGKVIAMTWDERGRLWVCETVDYPNQLQPPGKGRDRIRICEDTDNDGRADKFTVFAEKLSIPTAITIYRGGAIVQNGTETIYLKDTDGDGKADLRKTLISNWTLGDTHGGVSNFRYGLDNWIWAMQGYNNSAPVINGERQQAFRMGFFRFKLDNNDPPKVTELEFVRSNNNNTWGLGISEEGLIFGSTANHNPSVYMPIANRYYERVRGWSPQGLGTIADTHLFKPITEKVRQVDQHGGYTAGAGHALYTARTYPKEYWNRTAFVCGPTGKLIGTFLLKRDGADFRSTSPCNLLASDDEWTAPIMAEVGPDGNVWVIDWYNYIVQHNPTPQGFKNGKGNAYESDLRDKKHGRVYRVVYKGTDPGKPMSLADASTEKLIQALKHPNMFWRLQAQRLLVQRGDKTKALAPLMKLIGDEKIDATGLNVGAIHALRTIDGLRAPFSGWGEYATAVVALEHPSAAVRQNAARVAPHNVPAKRLVRLLNDDDAQVRLATLLRLSERPRDAVAGSHVAHALARPENAGDRWIRDAITSAGAAHDIHFLKMIAQRKNPPAEAAGIAAIVAEHYARGEPNQSISILLATLEQAAGNGVVTAAIINGLAKGWPKNSRLELDEDTEKKVVQLAKKLSPGTRGQLVKLATSWGSKGFEKYIAEIVNSLVTNVTDAKLRDKDRIDAARQLVDFRAGDDEVVKQLVATVSPRTSPELSTGIIEALSVSESSAVGAVLVGNLGRFAPSAKSAALRVLLRRPNSTKALLDAVEVKQLSLSDLSLDQRQSLAAHPNREIAARAKKLLATGGGLPNPDREKVLQALLPLAEENGDAELGKVVFKKQCSKCHMHSGEGEKIGPDLTGMAVHPKAELLTHIVDPSRSVEGNYRQYAVSTLDGRVLSGMLASESKTSIELFDTQGKKHTILREDIEELKASQKSLMPDGFEKEVPPEAIVNLLEFLARRGKFVPIPLDKVATIVSTEGMFFAKSSGVERMIFPDWSPKKFEGVPFHLVDPQGTRVPNVILLHGPHGNTPPKMPKSVTLPCNSPAKAIHLLSGVSGWGYPYSKKGTVSMIVRLHFDDGKTEDHNLINGEHFADYIRRTDVPQSKLAFMLRSQQIRYLAVYPKRTDAIKQIELVKGPDQTSPIVMAVTVESP